MIETVIRKYQSLLADPGFLRFQHQAVADVYGQLGQGYAQGEGEVALVTRLADTLKGRAYKGVKLHCGKIHGSKSYVSFNFRDKPTTKELGDLVLITLVSHGRNRCLQKLCIVQNKLLRDGKAKIDLEQLFLLKNFPLFSGSRGLFRGAKDVMFMNRQKCLGAYGFFESPGEMIHVNAGVLSEVLAGSASFAKSALGSASLGDSDYRGQGHFGPFPYPWFDHPIMYEEFFHRWLKRGFPFVAFFPSAPFVSSRQTHLDLHDFLRAWVSLRVGELVYSVDRTVDAEADEFSTTILRRIGFGEFVNLEGEDLQEEDFYYAGMQVMVIHLDVAEG
jgi:hypothetical protein